MHDYLAYDAGRPHRVAGHARALIAATIAALMGAMVATTAPEANVDLQRIAVLLGTVVLALLALRAWAWPAAWSWIVGALAFQALGGCDVHSIRRQGRSAWRAYWHWCLPACSYWRLRGGRAVGQLSGWTRE